LDLDLYLFLKGEQLAPAGERITLSEAQLGTFVGRYRLSQAPEIEGNSVPSEVKIVMYEGSLIACVPDDAPLTLVPIAPTSFRAVGGPNGYIYIEVDMNGNEVEGFTAKLDNTLTLVYEAEE